MPLSSVAKGIVFSLICLVLLGTMPIISNLRPAAIGALPFAFALSFWEVVFGLPMLLAELRGAKRGVFGAELAPPVLRRMVGVTLLTGALFGGATYLYVLGVEKAGATNAAIAMQATPLFAMILEALFLKGRKNAAELGLTFILLAALYYLGTEGSFQMSGLSVWLLLTLCVPLLWTIAHTFIKIEFRETPITPTQVTFFRVVVSSLVLFVILALVNPADFLTLALGTVLQPFSALMGLVYLLELVFWFHSIRHIDISLASSIGAPWPALTMILAFFLLGDSIAPYQIGALVVVIASIFGLTHVSVKKDRTRRAAA